VARDAAPEMSLMQMGILFIFLILLLELSLEE